MTKYYYKVTTAVGTSTCSLFWDTPPAMFILEYKIGETTVPQCGPIFVFDSVAAARRFISKMRIHGAQILKGTGPRSNYRRTCATGWRRWYQCWKPRGQRCKPLVPGTVFLRSFTPLEIKG